VAEERRLDQVVLTLDGSPLPVELYARLTSVRVEESVHLPDLFTVRFDDPHFALFDENRFSVGTRVDVAFRAEEDLLVVTRGEVTALSVEPTSRGRHELVLTGLDGTHRLARGPRQRTFVQMTDADIASQIADEHGLEARVGASGDPHPYVIQRDETDLAFLRERAARIGFDLWVADGVLHFEPRPSAAASPPALVWGQNLTWFRVRYSSTDRCDEVLVRSWDPGARRAVVGRASQPDPPTTAPFADQLASASDRAFGRITRSAGRFPAASSGEADALAGSLLSRASTSAVTVRAQAVGDPRLAAGASVELEGVGTRLAGSYVVTSVVHSYGAGQRYRTELVCGGKDSQALADLVGNGAGSGTAVAGQAGWGGLVVGLVTNADDPERLGRVKVSFPTLSDQEESAWARLATPGAGAERGLACVPEVGDEVLIGFEHGDARRPIVLGGLWNGRDAPPASDQLVSGGEVSRRVWQSRKRNVVELLDADKPSIRLAVEGDEPALLLEAGESRLTGPRRLVVDADEVQISAKRRMRLDANQIEIAADATVKISGNAGVELN
jgi:uncharacterized protein involved in type VI secretion and phage assembly